MNKYRLLREHIAQDQHGYHTIPAGSVGEQRPNPVPLSGNGQVVRFPDLDFDTWVSADDLEKVE